MTVNSLEPPALELSRSTTGAVVDCRLDHALALGDRQRHADTKVVTRGEQELVRPQWRIEASILSLPSGESPASVRSGVAVTPVHRVLKGSGLVVAPGLGGRSAGRAQGRSVAYDADAGVGVGPQVRARGAGRGVPGLEEVDGDAVLLGDGRAVLAGLDEVEFVTVADDSRLRRRRRGDAVARIASRCRTPRGGRSARGSRHRGSRGRAAAVKGIQCMLIITFIIDQVLGATGEIPQGDAAKVLATFPLADKVLKRLWRDVARASSGRAGWQADE